MIRAKFMYVRIVSDANGTEITRQGFFGKYENARQELLADVASDVGIDRVGGIGEDEAKDIMRQAGPYRQSVYTIEGDEDAVMYKIIRLYGSNETPDTMSPEYYEILREVKARIVEAGDDRRDAEGNNDQWDINTHEAEIEMLKELEQFIINIEKPVKLYPQTMYRFDCPKCDAATTVVDTLMLEGDNTDLATCGNCGFRVRVVE